MQHIGSALVASLLFCPPAGASSARDCPTVVHQADESVAFKPDSNRPADLESPLALDSQGLTVPIVVDLLKGRKAPTGRPLESKTHVASVSNGDRGWEISNPGDPKAPAVAVELPCRPRINRPSILQSRK